VNANQTDFPVRTMCRVLGVSHSGFYDWQGGPSRRALTDAVLSERIRDIHAQSDATYGMPRIRAELAELARIFHEVEVGSLVPRRVVIGISPPMPTEDCRCQSVRMRSWISGGSAGGSSRLTSTAAT